MFDMSQLQGMSSAQLQDARQKMMAQMLQGSGGGGGNWWASMLMGLARGNQMHSMMQPQPHTTPGTAANGGWSTTTTPAQSSFGDRLRTLFGPRQSPPSQMPPMPVLKAGGPASSAAGPMPVLKAGPASTPQMFSGLGG